MSDYSFSQQIVWPDEAEVSDAEVEKFAAVVGKMIEREFLRVVGFRPPPPMDLSIKPRMPCGCFGVHMPACRAWVGT